MHLWECMPKVFRKLVNDLCTPSLILLAGQNLFPNPPVEENEFAVHSKGGPNLCRPDAALHQGQEILVALRVGDEVRHGHLLSDQIAGVQVSVFRNFISECVVSSATIL